jgi:hypothetical protein
MFCWCWCCAVSHSCFLFKQARRVHRLDMKNDIMGNMVQSAVGPVLSRTNLRPLERANTLLDQEFSLNTIVHWVQICCPTGWGNSALLACLM